MSKTGRTNLRRSAKRNQRRRITVHGERRPSPDLRKLGRAVITAAMAEAKRTHSITREGDEEHGHEQ